MNTEKLNYPIPGHGERLRIAYINDTGKEVDITMANGRNRYQYPNNTIIVKESYSNFEPEPEEKPVMLTVMIKDPDHPASKGGWMWLVKDMQSGEKNLIDHEFCITCHSNANEKHPYGDGNPKEEFRDYVFFPYNPELR